MANYGQYGAAQQNFGYSGQATGYAQPYGNQNLSVVDQRDEEGAEGFQVVQMQVPRRQIIRTVQGPPQIQYQHVPGQVFERIEQVVVPGPVQTQQVVIPGPVVERVEEVQGPDNIVTRVEHVQVPGPVQERIEQVVVPGPEVVKEVRQVRPGKVTVREETYAVDGPVREEIVRENYDVEGPVHVRVENVDRPQEIIREVIQPRPVPQVVKVPRIVQGPIREIYVRVHDSRVLKKNQELRAEIQRLSVGQVPQQQQQQFAVRPPVQQFYAPQQHVPVVDGQVIQVLPQQQQQQYGGYVAPQQQFGGYAAAPQQQFGGYAAAPQQQFGGYAAAPQQQFGGYAAAPQQFGGYSAAPQQQYGTAYGGGFAQRQY